jgi:hypothetical protein
MAGWSGPFAYIANTLARLHIEHCGNYGAPSDQLKYVLASGAWKQNDSANRLAKPYDYT